MGAIQFELVSMPHSISTGPRRQSAWPQFNHDLHFVHTLAGAGALRVNGRIYPTAPDRVLAVPTRQLCHWDKSSRSDWAMINIHYRITLDADVPLEQRYAIPVVFRPSGLGAIHRKLRHWHKRWSGGNALAKAQVAAQVHGLIARYWSAHAAPLPDHPPIDPVVQDIRSLIERRAMEPFDATSLADEVFLSVSQMNRRFRAALGASPKAYWQQQRAALCRRALRQRGQTLKRLAAELGFNDLCYFNRWFRQHTGMTPGQYRRQSGMMNI